MSLLMCPAADAITVFDDEGCPGTFRLRRRPCADVVARGVPPTVVATIPPDIGFSGGFIVPVAP
jgi:hypothetical protein